MHNKFALFLVLSLGVLGIISFTWFAGQSQVVQAPAGPRTPAAPTPQGASPGPNTTGGSVATEEAPEPSPVGSLIEAANSAGNAAVTANKRPTAAVEGGKGSGGGSQGNAANAAPAQPTPPDYLQLKLMGTNISGLEFHGLIQPNSQQTYSYFKNKGFNVVRIPFDWNELQPDLYGNFDSAAKQHLDQNIAWAKNNGMAVILDAHNGGRRHIYRNGGFSDDFSNPTQYAFRLPYGDHNSSAGTLTLRDFGRGTAGTLNNPVAPANSYRVTLDARINSTSGASWNELYIEPYYINDQNRYSLRINPANSNWRLVKTINGTTTTLASGSKTWTLGQYYNFVIDINQATAGRINVSVDGTPLFASGSVNSDPALSHGYVSILPQGVNTTLRDVVVNIGGDTTSGGPIGQRITDSHLPLSAWQDFWTKMSQAYKDEPAIFGYDHNEPFHMPIPTTPANYSAAVASANGVPTATATVLAQTMTNAIRSTGDTKFIIVELDHWANSHLFTSQYGTNPTPWINDSLTPQKIVYSGHYYLDSDHSGTKFSSSTPPSAHTINSELKPLFQWCNAKMVACYMGEFGVANTPEWQPALTQTLNLMRQHNIWWTQWAGGDLYSGATTLQPTSAFSVDRLQMTTIQTHMTL